MLFLDELTLVVHDYGDSAAARGWTATITVLEGRY
jgi:hypothetical protein